MRVLVHILGDAQSAGVAFTENSPYFTDKYQDLRIYTKPVRFVYGKISSKNPLVKRMKQRLRLVDYQKKQKKARSNDKLSEGTSQYADT